MCVREYSHVILFTYHLFSIAEAAVVSALMQLTSNDTDLIEATGGKQTKAAAIGNSAKGFLADFGRSLCPPSVCMSKPPTTLFFAQLLFFSPCSFSSNFIFCQFFRLIFFCLWPYKCNFGPELMCVGTSQGVRWVCLTWFEFSIVVTLYCFALTSMCGYLHVWVPPRAFDGFARRRARPKASG